MGRELRGNREGIAREFGGIGREFPRGGVLKCEGFPRGGVLKCVYFPRGGLQKMVSKNDLGFSWQRVLGIRWPGLGFSCLPVCLPAIRALGFSCLSVVLYPKP